MCSYLRLAILFCLFEAYSTHRHDQRVNDLLVNTNYGYVLGSLGSSRNSRKFASFRGIPFAKPPVGDLRFQNPQPPKPWKSPYNATVDAPICLQPNQNGGVLGQEDCLYLNIYVPITHRRHLLPVLVLIPGGGYTSGSGASYMYGPQYFMDKEVILVTFNYRLACFGFVSTLDDEAPGNYAFKDQVMALRFVKENIRNFGGDKKRVTLFGESAGSTSVGIQLLSPLSNGLFQQAIGQSGSGLSYWVLDHNEAQLNTTKTLATYVGCESYIGDSRKLLECFRNVDAKSLVLAMPEFQVIPGLQLTPYQTVTEKKTDRNPEPFLEKSPYDYIKSGEFKKIPYIIGNNQDEGIVYSAPILTQRNSVEPFNANFDTLLPVLLQLNQEQDIVGIVNNISDFYLGGDHFVNISNPARIQGFIKLITDRLFLYSADQVVLSQQMQGHEAIWVYNLAYRGNFTVASTLAPAPDVKINFPRGVCHGDDIQYLFVSQNYLGPQELTGRDIEMSEIFVTLWTNFAIFGNPDPDDVFSWDKLDFGSNVTNENLNYLNITGSYASDSLDLVMERGFHLERMKFWTEQKIRENF